MLSAREGPPQLRAAALAVKAVDKDLRRDLNRRTRETMGPVWTTALAERIGWAPEQALLKGARVAAGNPPALIAAGSARPWRRGSTLIPRDHWHALEYGSSSQAFTEYRRVSPAGTPHTVRRRTKTHLRPRRRAGYIIGPTLAEVLPRTASLWVQTVVRTILDAVDERG